MAWFKKQRLQPLQRKKRRSKGLWYKSPTGKIIDADELASNLICKSRDVFT
jgi:acetyl-CoA carboxylase carboxyl transferase subunit beta